MCAYSAVAQNRQVTGTITDTNGTPVNGATVLVEGTTNATSSNASGQFTITAPANGTLLVTFIGFESQRVAIEGKTRLSVTLKENIQAIDDVIVVAFGTTTKEAFVGSAAQVKAEDLEKRQTTNVLDALVGSVPGLQVRGGSGQPGSAGGDINIRGINSMYAGTSPLVIVDGAPYPASLSNIPQSDIESVTVLKDAASAALYGARGAAGVIIVTTKRAKSKEAIVNVDMKWGVNSRAIKDYNIITDPGEYYEAYYTQIYNQYYYGQGMSASQAASQANIKMLSDLQYNVFTVPDGESLIVNGKLNPGATLGSKTTYNGVDYWMQPDNWSDAAYRNGLRQEYTASVNGSTDRSSYYMGLGYLNEEGIIDNSDFERITARFKNDYQAKKWLKVGSNIGYVHSLQDQNSNWGTDAGSSNLFAYTSRIAPIYPLYVRVIDANGNPVIKTDEYGNKAYDYGVASTGYGVSRPYLGTGNPLGENQYNKYQVEGNQLNGTGFIDIIFTKHLKLNISSTVTWGQTNTMQFGNMYYGTPANTGGYTEKQSTTSLRTNNLQTLNYNNSFGSHNVTALLGHEYYDSKQQVLYGKGSGMFSPDIMEISAAATKDPVTASNTARYNNEGYFLSGQYDYENKYYASVSFRRDASSNFDPDNRWGSFWSVGGAWILSKEDFMSSTTGLIDMLKLKVSIGQQGNDNLPVTYAYTDIYSLTPGSATVVTPVYARKGNKDITWETSTNLNLGAEFSLWKGRLSGSVDFFNKKTTDLLFWVSLPEESGTRGMYDNVGDMRNTGFEINLTGAIIRNKMIDWTVSGNISHYGTKILKLPASKVDPALGGYTEESMWFKVGGPMYNYYCRSYAGVDQYGRAMFYVDTEDENGKTIRKGGTTYDYSNASYYEQGTNLPKAFGGFGTNLRVGDFDVAMTFDYQIGGRIFDGYYASVIGSMPGSSSAGSAIHKDWTKSWSTNNTGSSLPRWQYGDQYNGSITADRFLTDASYLNFQSFVVGYTVPAKALKQYNVKMRIYAAGENLYFWSKRKGLDPRYSFEGNSWVVSFSPYRTVSGGVQLTF